MDAVLDLDRALATAERAAREAGSIQRSHASKTFAIERKGEIDLVTEVDVMCEEAIVGIIKDAYPDHGVLAEERGASAAESPYRWVIDPLDGTTNYAHGFPMYCASVGLEVAGSLAAGAVYDPNRDEMFTAVKGGGALLNGETIHVSDVTTLTDSLLATGFAYTIRTVERNNLAEFSRFIMRAQGLRRPGAAALDLCYVACGRLDGFWEFHLFPWDMAAGALIVQEAGGTVTGVPGEFSIYQPEIVASNGHIHQQMFDVLAGG